VKAGVVVDVVGAIKDIDGEVVASVTTLLVAVTTVKGTRFDTVLVSSGLTHTIYFPGIVFVPKYRVLGTTKLRVLPFKEGTPKYGVLSAKDGLAMVMVFVDENPDPVMMTVVPTGPLFGESF
jgi:repressor of nif and glnA expression